MNKIKHIWGTIQLFFEELNMIGGIYPDYSEEDMDINNFNFLK